MNITVVVAEHSSFRSMCPLEAATGTGENDEFESAWRDELMQQSWKAMKQQNQSYYTLLRMRLDAPDLTSGQLVEA